MTHVLVEDDLGRAVHGAERAGTELAVEPVAPVDEGRVDDHRAPFPAARTWILPPDRVMRAARTPEWASSTKKSMNGETTRFEISFSQTRAPSFDRARQDLTISSTT